MKGVVVYYSLTKKTELVATTAARVIGAEIKKIEETKSRKPGMSTMILGGFAALTNGKSGIKPVDIKPANYDMIIIGTPVWAGRPVPAVNAFIAETDFQGKDVYLISTGGAPENEKAMKNLAEKVEKKAGKIIGSFYLQTNKVPNDDLVAKTREEFRKYQGRKR